MKKYFALLLASSLIIISCTDDESLTTPTPEPKVYTSGTADFSNYVAVGNSLTAGFSDGALFKDGQEASMPNMLASQFALAGGGEFNIPYMADNLGGLIIPGVPALPNRLFLSFASGEPSPTRVEGSPITDVTQTLSGSYNNMGVPGAKSYHIGLEGYGSLTNLAIGRANPYFVRFASSPDASIIGDALIQNPSFFSLWIGSNDVLGYAVGGGVGEDHNITMNIDPTQYGSEDITNENVFASVYSGLLAGLSANGTKQGIVANIPNIAQLPYFTTVPHNPVPLDQATVDLLNFNYSAYNNALIGLNLQNVINDEELSKRTISFTAGEGNAVVIIDESLTDLTTLSIEGASSLINMRQATAEDLVVLPARQLIGTTVNNNPTLINGVSVPLSDKWVLTPEEQASIASGTDKINAQIDAIAALYNIPVVDIKALLIRADTGIPLTDGSTVTTTFGTGGGFSLDGVHLSPRGYAIVANEFIKKINETYGSNLDQVNPLDYTGLYIN